MSPKTKQRYRVFRVRTFTAQRPDAEALSGASPFVQGTCYAVALDEYDAHTVVEALLPKELKAGARIDVLGEVDTELPIYQVRVGPREPGYTGREHRCAALSRMFVIGSPDRKGVRDRARVAMKEDPHVVRMIDAGLIEISKEPLPRDRAGIF